MRQTNQSVGWIYTIYLIAGGCLGGVILYKSHPSSEKGFGKLSRYVVDYSRENVCSMERKPWNSGSYSFSFATTTQEG